MEMGPAPIGMRQTMGTSHKFEVYSNLKDFGHSIAAKPACRNACLREVPSWRDEGRHFSMQALNLA
jgi:hypothetical protein